MVAGGAVRGLASGSAVFTAALARAGFEGLGLGDGQVGKLASTASVHLVTDRGRTRAFRQAKKESPYK